MAKIVRLREGEETILLNELESKGIDVEEATVLSLGDELFLVIGKKSKDKVLDALEGAAYEKLLKKLRDLEPKDRVEDKLEKSLDSEELLVLRKLLKKGLVSKYKKAGYNKAVYVPKKSALEEFKSLDVTEVLGEVMDSRKQGTDSGEKSEADLELEREGVIVLENDGLAREFSARRTESIKAGEIKGLRGFDKLFYIIDCSVYNKLKPRILKALSERDESIEVLAGKLGISVKLARAALEFLKEEGEAIEKKKGVFKSV